MLQSALFSDFQRLERTAPTFIAFPSPVVAMRKNSFARLVAWAAALLRADASVALSDHLLRDIGATDGSSN